MVGPRYTIAQTRARVAACQIAAMYLRERAAEELEEPHQYHDIAKKLENEAIRLKGKAQEVRNRAR